MAATGLDPSPEIDNQGLLYKPERPQDTRTFQVLHLINQKYGPQLKSYHDLYRWSATHIDDFWGTVWDETDIVGHKGAHVVDKSALPAENPPWFVDANLNWAENMLRCRSADKIALVQATEPTSAVPEPPLRQVTYAELYLIVADLVSALLSLGLKAGDRVASYSSNCIENIAACLAATAIGCVWVSAAADFGPEGVFERFEQVRPSVIFAVDGVVYNGRTHLHLPKLSSLLASLQAGNIKPKVVVINAVSNPGDRTGWQDEWINWSVFVDEGRKRQLGRDKAGEIEWSRQSFDWPLWILFSSGTTGRPKPIVHRAGGMLLQAKKEFVICADLKPEDVFFYYTTTGWMMWNFLVAGLSVGCTLVLYDGSPLRDPAYLWRLTDDLGITIFGTSAKYLDQLSKVYSPKEHHNLGALRHIYSTGSPLAPPLFDFVYQSIKKDVLLASITGGTDICSLFAGMCTALPVYRGEIQCRMLGMAIEAYTPLGMGAGPDEAGDLVCLRPFPCMPIGFWPLPGFGEEAAVEAAKVRFQQAYFSEFANIWYHGDHVLITRSRMENGGGLIMLGRSDGVLNPGGIRFGSAELYDVLDMCFSGSTSRAAETILDYMAVGQLLDGGADERVILFVKLIDGERMSAELEKRIKEEIRARRTARHVPARIIQVTDIPYTLNGKRVEVPVKKVINGASVSNINPATLRNAECLNEYVRIGEQLRADVS
ncbi:acetoacetyl-CoA synthetase [Neolentinus lepideus HHB14362 ss-1]|uniref:Acetoacetyl-CoA synthetase n=1 Tax=Neolentinus lepideus HHB14362 ss-1 TaxID=1314782 RepID=A0A165S043_9AGAM|nr:acetoacetyl-CoA synthetase [Neolentinus lepideus HHB14362 ss-1]